MSRRPPRRVPRMARTLWSLSVLALLRERPMHPYELQRQMHLRHTDERLGLKRGSLYHAINQLQRDGLIEPIETSRAGRRPERTVYQITRDGEEELLNWTRELLSEPVREPSQFTAALAHIVHLRPRDALEQLQRRAIDLQATIAALEAVERGVGALVGRLAVLEVEHERALLQAQVDWLAAVIEDIRSEKLTWDFDVFKQHLYSDQHTVDKSQQGGEP